MATAQRNTRGSFTPILGPNPREEPQDHAQRLIYFTSNMVQIEPNSETSIEIAGMLQHKHTAAEDSFAGALKGPKTTETMKTFFLYFLLQGPLITFEFASIEGVCGGFGYNSNLKFPTPKNAFEILNVQAVLVIQWNPEVESEFAHVELGITATLSFRTGALKIEGELTPASFILDPSCHLLGGFALYTWFGNNKAASGVKGDWVFTIGGFHPLYVRLPQYPNPSRLGISWQFSNAISISGQAYFAITPKPFSFIAEGGLTVGVRFTLDLWLVSINIALEIGARLCIEGPPIQGRVHVDFWVFGFDVNFGDKETPARSPLTLDQFVEVVCQSHNSGMPSLNLPPAPVDPKLNQAHVFAVREELIPTNKAKSTPSGVEMWKVRGSTFEFSVTSKFAFNKAYVITPREEGPKQIPVDNTGGEINAKPMCPKSAVTSELFITITPDQAALFDDEKPSTEPLWDTNTCNCKDVPLALWDDPNSDPSYNKNPQSLLNGANDKSISLPMEIHIVKPKNLPSVDNTVPFNVEKFQLENMDAGKPIGMPESPTGTFEPLPDAGKEQWDKVKTAYTSKANIAEAVVDIFKSIGTTKLGWMEKKIKSPAGPLTGKTPKKIVNDLPKYYLWAPMLSAP
ncbi:hypothetical protein AbraIFM66950_009686 [Aspergillus brasiliensis]|nr:hypothetical protein AbraIFM66950_009686 [Aspergillus brasiliensis]